MRRSEEVLRAVQAELVRQKDVLDAATDLKSVTLVVSIDQRRRAPARAIFRLECQGPAEPAG